MDLRTARFVMNKTQIEIADACGLYQPNISAFEKSGKNWFLKSEYQNSVAFHREDIRIIMPASSFHLILCRNLVFTYFDVGLQREILNRLRQRLVPGGVLVIGCHETLPDELNLNGKGECVFYFTK